MSDFKIGMLNLNSFSLATRITVLMGAATYMAALAHIVVNNLGLMPQSVLRNMFDLGCEGNVPTWLNTIFWFTVGFSAMLCYSAERGRKTRWPWVIIGLIFIAASCDETAEIHENVGSALHELPGNSIHQLANASPGSPWIGYYAPVLGVVVLSILAYLFKRVNSRRSRIVALSGFACFFLSILMDFFQGMPDAQRVQIASCTGMTRSFLVECSILLEEVCELCGCICLTNAFLNHARDARANESS